MEINNTIFEKLTTKPFDSDDLFAYLNDHMAEIVSNLTSKYLKMEIVCRAIHKLTESSNDQAIQILAQLDFNHYPLYSLKIREYSKTKEHLKEARDIIQVLPQKMQKKRIYMPILKALIDWYPEDAFSYLIEISKRFKLDYSDISEFFDSGSKDIFNTDYEVLFEIVSSNQIIVDSSNFGYPVVEIKKQCPNCGTYIEQIQITDEERTSLIENFKTEYLNKVSKRKDSKNLTVEEKYQYIGKFDKFCEGREFNVFIDGANVLRHLNQKVPTLESYQRLFKIYMKLLKSNYKPLVILHRRHQKAIKKIFGNGVVAKMINGIILGEMDVFFTPYNMNDDEFFIWGALHTPRSMVVSNDQFRDHIFKISDEDIYSKTLVKWMQNTMITFKSKHKQDSSVKILFPQKISYIAQKNGGHWHVPIGDGNWMCVEL